LSGNGNECKPLLVGLVVVVIALDLTLRFLWRRVDTAAWTLLGQGLTLVPISAQLEITLSLSAELELTLSPI